MDDLKFTARKGAGEIEISEELLADWTQRAAPSQPTVRWPSFVCGYEHSDDYYSEGHTCELPVGHDGPHRCSLEWETRPEDICKAAGHVWGEWEPWSADERSALFMLDWKTPPTHYRRCSRECVAREFQGGERYAVWTALFP